MLLGTVAGFVSGTTKSSRQVIVIPHLILVFDILTVLSFILFVLCMKEGTRHCAIEFDGVIL